MLTFIRKRQTKQTSVDTQSAGSMEDIGGGVEALPRPSMTAAGQRRRSTNTISFIAALKSQFSIKTTNGDSRNGWTGYKRSESLSSSSSTSGIGEGTISSTSSSSSSAWTYRNNNSGAASDTSSFGGLDTSLDSGMVAYSPTTADDDETLTEGERDTLRPVSPTSIERYCNGSSVSRGSSCSSTATTTYNSRVPSSRGRRLAHQRSVSSSSSPTGEVVASQMIGDPAQVVSSSVAPTASVSVTSQWEQPRLYVRHERVPTVAPSRLQPQARNGGDGLIMRRHNQSFDGNSVGYAQPTAAGGGGIRNHGDAVSLKSSTSEGQLSQPVAPPRRNKTPRPGVGSSSPCKTEKLASPRPCSVSETSMRYAADDGDSLGDNCLTSMGKSPPRRATLANGTGECTESGTINSRFKVTSTQLADAFLDTFHVTSPFKLDELRSSLSPELVEVLDGYGSREKADLSVVVDHDNRSFTGSPIELDRNENYIASYENGGSSCSSNLLMASKQLNNHNYNNNGDPNSWSHDQSMSISPRSLVDEIFETLNHGVSWGDDRGLTSSIGNVASSVTSTNGVECQTLTSCLTSLPLTCSSIDEGTKLKDDGTDLFVANLSSGITGTDAASSHFLGGVTVPSSSDRWSVSNNVQPLDVSLSSSTCSSLCFSTDSSASSSISSTLQISPRLSDTLQRTESRSPASKPDGLHMSDHSARPFQPNTYRAMSPPKRPAPPIPTAIAKPQQLAGTENINFIRNEAIFGHEITSNEVWTDINSIATDKALVPVTDDQAELSEIHNFKPTGSVPDGHGQQTRNNICDTEQIHFYRPSSPELGSLIKAGNTDCAHITAESSNYATAPIGLNGNVSHDSSETINFHPETRNTTDLSTDHICLITERENLRLCNHLNDVRAKDIELAIVSRNISSTPNICRVEQGRVVDTPVRSRTEEPKDVNPCSMNLENHQIDNIYDISDSPSDKDEGASWSLINGNERTRELTVFHQLRGDSSKSVINVTDSYTTDQIILRVLEKELLLRSSHLYGLAAKSLDPRLHNDTHIEFESNDRPLLQRQRNHRGGNIRFELYQKNGFRIKVMCHASNDKHKLRVFGVPFTASCIDAIQSAIEQFSLPDSSTAASFCLFQIDKDTKATRRLNDDDVISQLGTDSFLLCEKEHLARGWNENEAKGAFGDLVRRREIVEDDEREHINSPLSTNRTLNNIGRSVSAFLPAHGRHTNVNSQTQTGMLKVTELVNCVRTSELKIRELEARVELFREIASCTDESSRLYTLKEIITRIVSQEQKHKELVKELTEHLEGCSSYSQPNSDRIAKLKDRLHQTKEALLIVRQDKETVEHLFEECRLKRNIAMPATQESRTSSTKDSASLTSLYDVIKESQPNGIYCSDLSKEPISTSHFISCDCNGRVIVRNQEHLSSHNRLIEMNGELVYNQSEAYVKSLANSATGHVKIVALS